MSKTVILGDEYDDAIKRRLMTKLRDLGATPLSSDWGVAGSQELDSLSVELQGEIISVQSETFVGLSISGPHALVDKIARLISE